MQAANGCAVAVKDDMFGASATTASGCACAPSNWRRENIAVAIAIGSFVGYFREFGAQQRSSEPYRKTILLSPLGWHQPETTRPA